MMMMKVSTTARPGLKDLDGTDKRQRDGRSHSVKRPYSSVYYFWLLYSRHIFPKIILG